MIAPEPTDTAPFPSADAANGLNRQSWPPSPAATVPLLFLDANVLFSHLLRSLLLRWHAEGRICVAWSERVEREWWHNFTRTSQGTAAEHEAVLAELRRLGPTSHWDSPTPRPVVGIRGVARSDQHVAWSAITLAQHAGRKAENPLLLLTFNIGDFRRKHLLPLGVAPHQPDDWLLRQIHSDAGMLSVFEAALASGLCGLQSEPAGWQELLDLMRRSQLRRSGALLQALAEQKID